MSEMQWKILTKVYDRVEAEMMKAALETLNIPVEFAQESVGGTIPVSFGAFAEIHIFVPVEKFNEAKSWLEMYENNTAELDEE
jgi:hypothetical protein